MDTYWSTLPKVFTLIKIIFGLLTGIFTLALILVLVLKINETVPFYSGEILSRNAPIDYRASYEASVSEIRVQEGDLVAKGDTLITLRNEELLSQYRTGREAYLLSQANIELYKRQMGNLGLMISKLKEQEQIVASRYSNNNSNRAIEILALDQQIKTLQENTVISKNRIEKEKELVKEGAVSELEYQENYQSHLEKVNELTELQKQRELQLNTEHTFSNTYNSELKELQLNTLSSDYELVNLRKLLQEEEGRRQTSLDKMELTSNELKKLVIVSDINGYVSQLFNTKQGANYVTKGTSLITIRPKEEEAFYAKLLINQEAIAKIDTGQTVHFKLEAYNFYQYGVLNGKITHISQQDTSQHFYLLANVDSSNPNIEIKSGFQVKGDIILRKIPLSRFILNRLFRTVGS